MGSIDLVSNATCYSLGRINTHPQFHRPPFSHDLALVSVEGEIEFSEKVQTIEISPDEVPENTIVTLSMKKKLLVLYILNFT